MTNLDKIFKAYDIRGLSPQELKPEIARDIGRGLAEFVPGGKIAVGRDMREDSQVLADALIDGLTQQGRDVIDIGQVSSDMIYFAVGSMELAGGAMITASHNARGYNGIKLTGAGVAPIGQDSGLDVIKQSIVAQSFKEPEVAGKIEKRNILTDFVKHAVSVAEKNFGEIGQLRIGYDAGNGMAGIFVDQLQKQTKLQIGGLYVEPDGTFPNHHPNPMLEENLVDLKKLVRENNLNTGIAFDGDGDRAFFVDEYGETISGSMLGALLANETLKHFSKALIVYSETSSWIVSETINTKGGTAILSRDGHSFVKAKMKESGAVLAVENSGHYYFRDNYNADSGLIAALCVLAILSNQELPLSKVIHPYRKYYHSGEQNFKVEDTSVLLKQLRDTFSDGKAREIDGLSIEYPDWWFNIRASNTEPLVRLNIEANDETLLKQKLAQIKSIIS